MAPYLALISTSRTIILQNAMLLSSSAQFLHISAKLYMKLFESMILLCPIFEWNKTYHDWKSRDDPRIHCYSMRTKRHWRNAKAHSGCVQGNQQPDHTRRLRFWARDQKPYYTSLYYCGKRFHTETLISMREEEPTVYVVAVSGSECLNYLRYVV